MNTEAEGFCIFGFNKSGDHEKRVYAQIVPVKVKYFQTFPNETKSWFKKIEPEIDKQIIR